eukprot:7652473-Prorocentrum_lima.AAC.1
MPSDHASVCVALQCRRASSSAIRAVPMPSKSESSATILPGVGGRSGPRSLAACTSPVTLSMIISWFMLHVPHRRVSVDVVAGCFPCSCNSCLNSCAALG